MAEIDPAQTSKVPADQAAAAAAGRRRTRTAPAPAAVPQGPAGPVAQPGDITQALAARQGQAGPLDEAALVRLLRGLGYSADNDGPDLRAHADDEGSLIEFVDTGVVRFPAPLGAAVKQYRLRPPLFGEHRMIRTKIGDVLEGMDEAALARQKATRTANEAVAEARTIEDEIARSEAMLAAKRLQRAADDESEEAVERLMLPWWELVFSTLGMPGEPTPERDDFGPWAMDKDLAVKVVNHWRVSPTAPGR